MTRAGSRNTHPGYGPRRRGRRLLGIFTALLLLAGGGYAVFSLGGGGAEEDDPQVTAARKPLTAFLAAWAGHDATGAARHTDTPDNAASLLTSVLTNLKPSRTTLVSGDGQKKEDGKVFFPFSVAMEVPGAGEITWRSRAEVNRTSGTWKVEFTSPMIHPELSPGQTLALKTDDTRAKVLDSRGRPLQAASLVGIVDPVSGKGTSGLEARYDKVLSGGRKAGKSLVVADRQSGRAVKNLGSAGPAEGRPVRTTIDPRIQTAAADAVAEVKDNAAIVAINPRNGHILAAVNRPGGLNRALEGRYPPGSTFKVVTTAALLKGGTRPTDAAACPKFAHVDGQRFENQGQFSSLPARPSPMSSPSPATHTSSTHAAGSPAPICGMRPRRSGSGAAGTSARPRTTAVSLPRRATTTRPPPPSVRHVSRRLRWSWRRSRPPSRTARSASRCWSLTRSRRSSPRRLRSVPRSPVSSAS